MLSKPCNHETRKGEIMPVVKLGKSYQVSLPKRLLEEMGLEVGDYFEVQREGNRIVMIPKVLVEKSVDVSERESIRSATRTR